jgi:hypothetical protein
MALHRSRAVLAQVTTVTVVALARSGFALAQADHTAHQAKAGPTITLTTKPDPPVAGENTLTVSVKSPAGEPVVGADVWVVLVMPATPSTGVAEIRKAATLEPDDNPTVKTLGVYIGRIDVPSAGRWQMTVTVRVYGKEFGEVKVSLPVR